MSSPWRLVVEGVGGRPEGGLPGGSGVPVLDDGEEGVELPGPSGVEGGTRLPLDLAEGGPGALEDVDGLAEGLRDLGGAGFGREVGRFGGDGDFEVHIRRPFPFSSGYI